MSRPRRAAFVGSADDGRIDNSSPFERFPNTWWNRAPAHISDTEYRRTRFDTNAHHALEQDRARWLAQTGQLDELELRLLQGGTFSAYGTERSCPSLYREIADELLALAGVR